MDRRRSLTLNRLELVRVELFGGRRGAWDRGCVYYIPARKADPAHAILDAAVHFAGAAGSPGTGLSTVDRQGIDRCGLNPGQLVAAEASAQRLTAGNYGVITDLANYLDIRGGEIEGERITELFASQVRPLRFCP